MYASYVGHMGAHVNEVFCDSGGEGDKEGKGGLEGIGGWGMCESTKLLGLSVRNLARSKNI